MLDINQIRCRTLPLAFGAVFACVLIFGGMGFILDLLLDKKPIFFIIGMVIAFISTNFLIIFISKRIKAK